MNNQGQNSNPNTTIKIPDYQITKTLYSGSRTIVDRAIRNLDQLPLVIKLLKNPYPTFSELVQLRFRTMFNSTSTNRKNWVF